jgi:hypothetical protein
MAGNGMDGPEFQGTSRVETRLSVGYIAEGVIDAAPGKHAPVYGHSTPSLSALRAFCEL